METNILELRLDVIDWRQWEQLIKNGYLAVCDGCVMAMATHPTDRTIQVWATFF